MTELAHFLAHALALENQASQRYGELARHLDLAGNHDTAALFGKMADFSRMHADEINAIAKPHAPLPVLQPWQYEWTTPEPPEVGDASLVGATTSVRQALGLAIANERRGWEYYNHIAVTATDGETRRLARTFATEEAEHVLTLERWLTALRPNIV